MSHIYFRIHKYCTMFHLPPPPLFTLPPPPMLPSDFIHKQVLSQLTCSLIRQKPQPFRLITNPRLIVISSISFLIVILLSVLLFMCVQYYHRKRSLVNNDKSKSIRSVPDTRYNNVTMYTSRSYESISSAYTGIYVESIDTTATTFSTDQSNMCIYCHQERDYSNASLPPFYHTLDTVSS